MYLPSNSTLDAVEEIGSYGEPNSVQVEEIREAMKSHTIESGCAQYIIAFDGIIVIP